MPIQPDKTTTVLLCGVGGQGTILAADLLARAAMGAGCQVKVSEIHGMAQRGGAVTTVVRFGGEVNSMVCDKGSADVVVSFESVEALRNISFLKAGGKLLVSDEIITPLPVATGSASMPENVHGALVELGAVLVPANELAVGAGTAKASNVVMLGALSTALGFDDAVWEEAIAGRVPPKTIDINIAAFHAGAQNAR